MKMSKSQRRQIEMTTLAFGKAKNDNERAATRAQSTYSSYH